jgi:F0F1-type ATP synthase delta subunit
MISTRIWVKALLKVSGKTPVRELLAWLLVLKSHKIQKKIQQLLNQQKSAKLLHEEFDFPLPLAKFLVTLNAEGEWAKLAPIIEQTLAELYQQKQGAGVSAITPQPISTAGQRRLAEIIEEQLKIPVALNNELDPEMLGGIKFEIGRHLIDLGLKTQVVQLKQTMQRS